MSKARRLLVVEDDEGLQRQLRWQLGAYELLQASDRTEALALVRARAPQVVLLDLGLPPDPSGVAEGFAALEEIQRARPTTRIVVMTGREGREHALRAIGMGALDFYSKPVDVETLATLLERAFFVSELEEEIRRSLEEPASPSLPGVIGQSPGLRAACRVIERVAPAEASVVILGESGTGKEVMARALHDLSPRRHGRFVAINCAAIPPTLLEAELFGFERGAFTGALKQTPGRLELAHGGTLFLDEIGDLPVELQAKLLRFVQERVIERLGGREEIRLDVRIVCATHRDLRRLMVEGRFREDLYYRLAEIIVTLPPLRERPGDAVLLARHLLEVYRREQDRPIAGFTQAALRAIDHHHWPGNVRELQNRLKRAVLLAEGRKITVADLDLGEVEADDTELELRVVRERAERAALQRALARTGGNISQAAALLGISRPTLYDLIRLHRLRD
ncbi:MAG: PEP-CTERM-box response regulator transcription factor [Geminicoccaceae bacterium]|nr:PEP-CTERM-box response regulator transcription factor [Geminicoccaceae bacterium]MCX8101179.1 PEP-CTERM-box response regulator transcription factor [Geminicoccaceae bacterium]MDW8370421.1 PEP-CTERM-box response regulator transcription factor [Geminicoccaceae bacterium]